MSKLYVNTAGAGKMSPATLQTIESYLAFEIEAGGYTAMSLRKNEIEKFYSNAARLLHIDDTAKIAYTDSASRSWNTALQSAPLRPGATIVTLASEFCTNLISIYNYAKKIHARVELIPCRLDGSFSLEELESRIPESNSLVALSHATAQGSIINPVAEISKIARSRNALYLIDGCQAAGNIPVNVSEIGCDAYTATGRKWLCGPRGTGFLYIDYRKFTSSHLDLNAAEITFNDSGEVDRIKIADNSRRFELWERSIACMLGLSCAIEQQLEATPEYISQKLSVTGNILRQTISANDNLILLGKKESLSGITGFIAREKSAEQKICERFSTAGVNLGIMSSSNCPAFLPPERRDQLIFRISPAYTITPDETAEICDILIKF